MLVESGLNILWKFLNTVARLLGIASASAGTYYAAKGIYMLLYPQSSGVVDKLGFSPSFRPFVIAVVLLVIGVHFICGKAHRPDLVKLTETEQAKQAQSWWTGDPLDRQPRSESED